MLFSCRRENQKLQWQVETLVPILSSRLEISDLIADSTLSLGNDSLYSIVFRNKIGSFKLDEIASVLEESFENTVKLNSIDLGKRIIVNNISLGRLAASSGLTGQLIIASNGNNVAIPALNGIGPEVFDIDATDYFQNITLNDGWLVLRMENGFPIELTDLQYEIRNKTSGSLLLQNTLSSLASSAVHYDSVRLNNGTIIEGELQASLLNMDSPGSNGVQVLIDTSDAISIQITIDKLDPESATAIFPTQNLVNDTTAAILDAPGAKLNRIYVNSGLIFIDATSTIDDNIFFQYSLPGATNANGILTFIEILDPAPLGGISTTYSEFPISSCDLDLTGPPDSINAFNMLYTILQGRIDSSGKLINLNLQDSVFLQTGIKELTAERGYGYIGTDTIETLETSEVDFFQNLSSGDFDFEEVNLSLEIENNIGAPIDFVVNSVNARNDNSAIQLNWTSLGQFLALDRANEIIEGDKPACGLNSFLLNSNNSNIDQLFELKPKFFDLNVSAYLNRNVPETDLSQFLNINYGIEAYLNLDIPLHLSMSQISFQDTSEFEYADLDPDNLLQSGSLNIIAKNFFPIDFTLELILLDADLNALDTLSSADEISSASIQNDRAFKEIRSDLSFPFTKEQVPNLQEAKYFVFKTELNTSSNQKVKFYSENYLDLQLIGDLSILTP